MNRAPQMISNRPRLAAVAAGLFFLAAAAHADNPNSIVYSKHNLSATSTNAVRATTETEICIFCHTPHGASATDGPLWNHQTSTALYQPFVSSTLTGAGITIGQPDGTSRLCLSCHDGTVALGSVNSRAGGIAMNNTMSSDYSLGTDLRTDHPVSFKYTVSLASAIGNLVNPGDLPPEIPLDSQQEMQCTTCHDPHSNQYGSFLVMNNSSSELCQKCHRLAGWTGSAHAISTKALPAALSVQMATGKSEVRSKAVKTTDSVGHAACAGCHVPHTAGTKQALMRFSTPERNCLDCHAGEGPGNNVASEITKISAHATLTRPDAHSPRENLVNPPVRHVTCVDCHNPHATGTASGAYNQVSGALAAVAGVNVGGSPVSAISQEYELCFRCHGDSATRGPAVVPRQFVQTNTRLEFNPGNVSFHPVETLGKNFSSPSLLSPLTSASLIRCSDCHNSDQSPAAGGSGANGPHGSVFSPLLERRLLLTDGTPYNPGNFALCYKCHSSSVVDSSLASSWSGHQTHLEQYRAACTTCHDSHAATQPHLINFNTAYVSPNQGVLNYLSTGPNHGTCTLTCHDGSGRNKPHAAKSY